MLLINNNINLYYINKYDFDLYYINKYDFNEMSIALLVYDFDIVNLLMSHGVSF